MIEKLQKLGYDVSDMHWLHSFYKIGMVVFSPDLALAKQQEAKDNRNAESLNKLINGGDKFYIDQAINFGRGGLSCDDVQFRSKPPEVTVWFVPGCIGPFGTTRNVAVDGFEIWGYIEGQKSKRLATSHTSIVEFDTTTIEQPYRAELEKQVLEAIDHMPSKHYITG